MVYSEPFTGANYNNGSLPPFPVYQTSDMMESQCWYGDTSLAASGLSEVQMNATYDVTENTQTDALAGIFNQNPLPPLIHHMESKNYDSSVERSGLTFYGPQERSRNGGLDNLVQLSQWMPKEEPISFMDTDCQYAESPAFPVQPVNVNNTPVYLSALKGEADTSDVAPETLRSETRTNRERARGAESRRRYIVSQRVQALQALLPPALKDKRGNQESIVQDVIGHIKYLQLQLKELSRSRLGGDSSSGPSKFNEGQQPHEQLFVESLEENLESLLQENPAEAHKLFESKGLYAVPMAFSNALLCNKV
ncbi:uncharacterized protein [Spinacia oleracea]|uniref:Uncharacterized protein isoform X3 n=1 Tax=Spinacia oleracea TaxID=3562 RepID=A0A9R0JFZ7_SPIOL|nr:uncharacterized protein LOC110805086 isoform X3 [Spinacia oleracea]